MINLPSNTHPHDEEWLKGQLIQLQQLINQAAARFAAARYDEVYEEKINDESISVIQRENEARREANIRLRKYVEANRNKYRQLTN